MFLFSNTGCTNWNVFRRMVTCPRECVHTNKGESYYVPLIYSCVSRCSNQWAHISKLFVVRVMLGQCLQWLCHILSAQQRLSTAESRGWQPAPCCLRNVTQMRSQACWERAWISGQLKLHKQWQKQSYCALFTPVSMSCFSPLLSHHAFLKCWRRTRWRLSPNWERLVCL